MFGERVSIGIPCGRSESSPTLHLIVMMLHVLAQLFAFTRFPFMSGKVWKIGISPETSSQNRDLGGFRLRRLMLKMSVSLETSSKNGDIEIAVLIFGSPKMSVSPETSSKNWDAEKALLRPDLFKTSISPETSSKSRDSRGAGEFEVFSKMRLSPETSSKKWDGERALSRYLLGAFSEDLQDSPRGKILKKPMVFQHICSKVSVSLETSSKNAFERVFKNVIL